MNEDYQIVAADEAPWDLVGGGINAYNNAQAGEQHGKLLCFVVRAPDGKVMGGIIGETHWDWFYVNLMWLPEELRRHGYGKQLLALAEDEARRRGARHAYLDTFSFQAPEFYKKYGYEVFGTLENFPQGHQRYFLTKDL